MAKYVNGHTATFQKDLSSKAMLNFNTQSYRVFPQTPHLEISPISPSHPSLQHLFQTARGKAA